MSALTTRLDRFDDLCPEFYRRFNDRRSMSVARSHRTGHEFQETTMTHSILKTLAASLTLACAAAATAQPGPGASAPSGPACGPMAGASAPAAGCPAAPGGLRRGMGPRWGQGYTPGWALMTPAERQQHQAKLASLKTYEECRAYMDQQHEQMVARAKEKGQAVPPKPRRDACATLPKASN